MYYIYGLYIIYIGLFHQRPQQLTTVPNSTSASSYRELLSFIRTASFGTERCRACFVGGGGGVYRL